MSFPIATRRSGHLFMAGNRIVRCSLQLSDWKIGETQPAADDKPVAFGSAKGTLRKFMQAAG